MVRLGWLELVDIALYCVGMGIYRFKNVYIGLYRFKNVYIGLYRYLQVYFYWHKGMFRNKSDIFGTPSAPVLS